MSVFIYSFCFYLVVDKINIGTIQKSLWVFNTKFFSFSFSNYTLFKFCSLNLYDKIFKKKKNSCCLLFKCTLLLLLPLFLIGAVKIVFRLFNVWFDGFATWFPSSWAYFTMNIGILECLYQTKCFINATSNG